MDADDRERLHAAIGLPEEQFLAGQAIPAKAVIELLREELNVKRYRIEFPARGRQPRRADRCLVGRQPPGRRLLSADEPPC